MRARSSSNLPSESFPNPTSSNPKLRNRRHLKQPFIPEESPVDTMADQRTMAELLRAPTEDYAEAIVKRTILMITSVGSTKLLPPSNFQQRFDESFHEAWDRYKDLLRACPHHGFAELHQLDTFYNALNPADQDSFNSDDGGNLLERCTQDVLTIIENKSKCLAADGNTFSELRDNIQGYVAAAAINYNQGNSGYCPPEDTLTDQDLTEYTIKVPHPLVQKPKPPSQTNFVVHQRDPLHPNIPYPLRMHKQKQQEKHKVQIHKFWQMFKQLHINITLADALILIPKYQKMLKALLSNKEKLLELANTPLNENFSAVILKKLPKKLGDPRKFLILCGFSELKCKALADLGASINLMPLSIWKKLALSELIFTRMTFELANRAICTPAGIARDVFVSVGKFTFPADFVIVDFESNPRVPLILGRHFLRTILNTIS
nr:reverse transcriptase domain-containing protein [Tanacetum cinerariifolium]